MSISLKKGLQIGLPALLAAVLILPPLAAHADEAAPEETPVSEEVVTEEVITEEVVTTPEENTTKENSEEVVETTEETTEEETPQALSALQIVQQTEDDEVDYGHAGVPYPNSSDSNKESHWEDENTQCFKHEGADMWNNAHAYLTNDGKTVVLKSYGAGWYGDHYGPLIVKAANTDLVTSAPVAGLPGYHAVDYKEISHYIVCKSATPDEPEVDYCDRADKPGGVSIAQWLEDNGIDPADCFEYELVQQCGQFDVDVTKTPVGISYGFQYALGANQDTVYPGLPLPAVFAEDEGGGSVQITVWMVGGESDYVRGTDIPNFWDNNGLTITIDTDCEDPPTEGEFPTVTVIPEYCEYEDGSVVGGSISVDGGTDVKSVTVYDESMVEQSDLTNLPAGEYTVVVVFNDGSIAPTADGWTVDPNDPAKASTTVTVEEAECEIAKPVVVITDSVCVEGSATDVTVTVTGAPGVTSEYRINNGTWTPYTGPFTASAGDEIDVRHQAPPQYEFPNGKDTAKHNNLVVTDPECEPEVEVVTPVLPTFTTCPVTPVLPDGVTKVDGSENVYENATAFYEVNEDNITIYPKSGVEFAESDDYTIGDDGSIVVAFPAEGDCPTDKPGLALTGADISGGVLAVLVLFGLGALLLATRKRHPEASNQEV